MKDNLKYIDIAKAILIILMVIGHATESNTFIHRFIYLFHISAFMMISGFLHKKPDFKNKKENVKYILKKELNLYLFYLKYEFLFCLLTPIFLKLNFYNYNDIMYGNKIINYDSFFAIFKHYIEILLGMGREPFCGPLWYIISYIIVIAIYNSIECFFSKNNKKEIILTVSSIIFFMIGIVMKNSLNIPRIAPAFTMLFIFRIGVLIRKSHINLYSFKIFTISIILLILLYNYENVNLNNNTYTNPLTFIISSICGFYMIIYLSKKIESFNIKKIKSVLIYIGKNTLIILGQHFLWFKFAMIIQFIICKIDFDKLYYLKGYKNNNWILLYVLFGVLIPVLIQRIHECRFIKKTVNNIKVKNN